LQKNDFEIGDKSQKGTIRRKIKVLKEASSIFDGKKY
jgi:hypothetical protein